MSMSRSRPRTAASRRYVHSAYPAATAAMSATADIERVAPKAKLPCSKTRRGYLNRNSKMAASMKAAILTH
jgi:hypothetical protein